MQPSTGLHNFLSPLSISLHHPPPDPHHAVHALRRVGSHVLHVPGRVSTNIGRGRPDLTNRRSPIWPRERRHMYLDCQVRLRHWRMSALHTMAFGEPPDSTSSEMRVTEVDFLSPVVGRYGRVIAYLSWLGGGL